MKKILVVDYNDVFLITPKELYCIGDGNTRYYLTTTLALDNYSPCLLSSDDKSEIMELIKFIYHNYINHPICVSCTIDKEAHTVTIYTNIPFKYRWNSQIKEWTMHQWI